MQPYILVFCFIATVGLALPLEKDNAQLPLDHSVKVQEESKPQNDVIPIEKPRRARSKSSSDEIMDTASNIVFRPLFAYRKQVAQRRRVYQNRNKNRNNNRRQSNRPPKQNYPYGYPSYGYPYYMDREFPHVP